MHAPQTPPLTRGTTRRVAAIGSSTLLVAGGVGTGLLLGATTAQAASTYTVTSTADDGSTGTLRWALTQANGDPGSTISFASGATGTITLTSPLNIVASVTINGPGRSSLAIDGANSFRIFYVTGGTATISGLTLTNTNAAASSPAALTVRSGATVIGDDLAITNTATFGQYAGPIDCGSSTIQLSNVSIAGNQSSANARTGIVFATDCDITISSSSLTGNSSTAGFSSVIFGRSSSNVVITDSVIAGNSTTIDVSATSGTDVHLFGTTISGNTNSQSIIEAYGGSASVVNSTISGNTSQFGLNAFAFTSSASLYLLDSTITNNSTQRSTINTNSTYAVAALVTKGSIISGNASASEVDTYSSPYQSSIWASQNSLIGTTLDPISNDLGGNLTNVSDPGLGPLAENGGPTRTHEPLSTSPALDAGLSPQPSFPGNQWDQRGNPFVRTYGVRSDIGAVERQPGPQPTPPTTVPSGDPVTPAFVG